MEVRIMNTAIITTIFQKGEQVSLEEKNQLKTLNHCSNYYTRQKDLVN